MTSDYRSNDTQALAPNPQRLRATLRAWLGLIVIGTILGAIVGFAVASITPPTYSSSVTLLVAPTPTDEGITNTDIQVAQALAPTYAELATTGPVLRRVIADTGVDVAPKDLAESITTHVPAGTSLLTITVALADPQQAADVANAIATELEDFGPQGVGATAFQVDLTVVDPALPPAIPDGPGIIVRTALGGAIGLFMSLSFVFLIENIWPQRRPDGGATSEAEAYVAASAAGGRQAGPAWPADPAR